MAATVTGTFVIIDRATGPMRRMEAQARKTDKAFSDAGQSMDSWASPRQLSQMDKLERQLDDIDASVDKTRGSTVDFNAELDRTIDRMNGVEATGRRFNSRLVVMAGIIAGLSPLIVDLAGGLGALVGSLGRALKGASALAVGGIGVLGVALGGLVGIIAPAVSRMGQLGTAFSDLTTAQQQYGKSSQEAADAAKQLQVIQKQLRSQGFDVGGAMGVLRGLREIREEFMSRTQTGQGEFFDLMADGIERAKRLLPAFASSANRTMKATRLAVGDFLERLDGPEFRTFLDRMTRTYEVVARPLARSFANIGEALGNIAMAVRPDMERLAFALDRTTEGWAQATSDIGAMRRNLRPAVSEVGDWYRLLKASWYWMTALFGAGADQGQGLVQSMTDKLNEQTEWFRKNPATMKEFYDTAIQGTKDFARLVGDIAPSFMDIAEAMRPVVKALESIVNLLSNIQIGNINALTLAIVGLGVGKLGGMINQGGKLSFLNRVMNPAMLSPGLAGAAGAMGGATPVYVVNAAQMGLASAAGGVGVGGMASPTRMTTVGGAVGSAKALRYGVNPATGAMVTGSRLGAGAGMLGRGAMAGARVLGRGLWPLAALMGIGDFISTEGNILDRFAGAASGATFGLFPKRQTSEEIGQRVTQSFTDDKNPLTSRAAFARERQRILRDAEGGASVGGLARFLPGPVGLGLAGANAIRNANLDDRTQRELTQLQKLQSQFSGNDIAQAMAIRLRSGKGKSALRKATQDLYKDIGKAGNIENARTVSQQTLTMARAAARANPKLRGEYEKLARGVERRLKGMGDNVAVVNGTIYKGSQERWEKIREAMSSKAERARQEVSKSFTGLQKQALGQLVAFGMSPREARAVIKGAESSGGLPTTQTNSRIPANAPGGRRGYAAGGRIAGMGKRDTVPLTMGMAAPGELIVNRHTEGRVNRMLRGYGTSLGKEVNGERLPHSAVPGGGPGTPHIFHARGGRVGGAYPDAMGALPGLDALGAVLARKFGLRVTSGMRPGAITTSGNPSDHGWGGAIDVSNGVATPQMDAAHAWAQRTIGPAIKQMLYRTMVGGNHFDHIHIALQEAYARNPAKLMALIGGGGGRVMLRGGGGGGTPSVRLNAPTSSLGGIPGAMSNRGMAGLAAGMERAINRRLGGGGAAGGGKVMGASVYGGSRDPSSGTVGYRGDSLPGQMAFAELGMGNAMGGLPYKARARISYKGRSVIARKMDIGAGGGPVNGMPRAIDLWHETAARLGFPFGLDTVKVQRMAHGGRMPQFGGWFGNGGRFTADRPTLIGVGERGSEDVQITPKGRGNAGGRGVNIGSIHIENHKDGDITKQVKRELAQAFNELEREIRNDSGSGIA